MRDLCFEDAPDVDVIIDSYMKSRPQSTLHRMLGDGHGLREDLHELGQLFGLPVPASRRTGAGDTSTPLDATDPPRRSVYTPPSHRALTTSGLTSCQRTTVALECGYMPSPPPPSPPPPSPSIPSPPPAYAPGCVLCIAGDAQQGVESLNPIASSPLCGANLALGTAMSCTATAPNAGRRLTLRPPHADERAVFHYFHTTPEEEVAGTGLARQAGYVPPADAAGFPRLLATANDQQYKTCMAYDPTYAASATGAGALGATAYYACNQYGLPRCPSKQTAEPLDNAPYNPCNNEYRSSDVAGGGTEVPPVLTLAEGILRRLRYSFTGGTITPKPRDDIAIPYEPYYMYAPRQCTKGVAPGWIVNDASAAWCPHPAFCPTHLCGSAECEAKEVCRSLYQAARALDSSTPHRDVCQALASDPQCDSCSPTAIASYGGTDPPRAMQYARPVPQYFMQHEVCINTRLVSPAPSSGGAVATGPVVLQPFVQSVEDYQQPWYYRSSSTPPFVERNLCAPTALAVQHSALRMLAGHSLSTSVTYDTHGWQDYMFDGPGVYNPATHWSGVSAPPLPSFDWYLNTNNNGAQDVPNTVGSTVTSIIKGAVAFYANTGLAGTVSAVHHKGPGGIEGVPPSGLTMAEGLTAAPTLAAITASLSAFRTPVLMLDSWSVSKTDLVFENVVHVYDLGVFAGANPDLQEAYEYNSEQIEHSIGHSVVAVGIANFDSRDFVVVLDNDQTTEQYVALPWLPSGTSRGVFEALIATLFVDAPVQTVTTHFVSFMETTASPQTYSVCAGEAVQVEFMFDTGLLELTDGTSCMYAGADTPEMMQVRTAGHTFTFANLGASPGSQRFFTSTTSNCNIVLTFDCPPGRRALFDTTFYCDPQYYGGTALTTDSFCQMAIAQAATVQASCADLEPSWSQVCGAGHHPLGWQHDGDAFSALCPTQCPAGGSGGAVAQVNTALYCDEFRYMDPVTYAPPSEEAFCNLARMAGSCADIPTWRHACTVDHGYGPMLAPHPTMNDDNNDAVFCDLCAPLIADCACGATGATGTTGTIDVSAYCSTGAYTNDIDGFCAHVIASGYTCASLGTWQNDCADAPHPVSAAQAGMVFAHVCPVHCATPPPPPPPQLSVDSECRTAFASHADQTGATADSALQAAQAEGKCPSNYTVAPHADDVECATFAAMRTETDALEFVLERTVEIESRRRMAARRMSGDHITINWQYPINDGTTTMSGHTLTADVGDKLFLNWNDGAAHTLAYFEGVCPTTKEEFLAFNPTFVTHDSTPQMEITPTNPGTFCFACTRLLHYENMHFTYVLRPEDAPADNAFTYYGSVIPDTQCGTGTTLLSLSCLPTPQFPTCTVFDLDVAISNWGSMLPQEGWTLHRAFDIEYGMRGSLNVQTVGTTANTFTTIIDVSRRRLSSGTDYRADQLSFSFWPQERLRNLPEPKFHCIKRIRFSRTC